MRHPTHVRAVLAAAVTLGLLASVRLTARPADAQPGPVFEDVTVAAGITATHHTLVHQDYWAIGQAWGDYDGDGWLDLYVTDSIGPNTLYRNQGDGTFAVSPLAEQVSLPAVPSGGAVWADYDNDGWSDLYVLNMGANVLYRNVGGTSFVDVTAEAGVGDRSRGETGAWGDYDGDGDLDLYVASWFCADKYCGEEGALKDGLPDRLYRNDGDGTFSDVTDWLGYVQVRGAAFAASWLDYDDDGDLDLYVVNDKGYPGPTPPGGPINHNVLWRNDGPGCDGWCFTDVSAASGADIHVMGMGLAVGDYDNDLDLDMYFSHDGPMVLLQNQGDATFRDVAPQAGVDIGPDAIGWGPVLFDYDNDGWRDIYVALGVMDPNADTRDERNVLLRNRGDGTFAQPADHGAADPATSYGVAYADYDKDGWLDLVVGNSNSGYQLYRNVSGQRSEHGWLALDLVGQGLVPRDAVGARAYVTTDDGRVQMAEVKSGSSLGAGNTRTLHFGLGTAAVERVRIRWPDGTVETRRDLEAGRWRITYPGPSKPAPAYFPAALSGF